MILVFRILSDLVLFKMNIYLFRLKCGLTMLKQHFKVIIKLFILFEAYRVHHAILWPFKLFAKLFLKKTYRNRSHKRNQMPMNSANQANLVLCNT